ncbi:hypothetical protein [Nocardia farcinica]|nr:hypothetical protein [Nocardia farcinica]
MSLTDGVLVVLVLGLIGLTVALSWPVAEDPVDEDDDRDREDD